MAAVAPIEDIAIARPRGRRPTGTAAGLCESPRGTLPIVGKASCLGPLQAFEALCRHMKLEFERGSRTRFSPRNFRVFWPSVCPARHGALLFLSFPRPPLFAAAGPAARRSPQHFRPFQKGTFPRTAQLTIGSGDTNRVPNPLEPCCGGRDRPAVSAPG